ncbi:MAG: tetratricopeptide repeat protein, partial [Proteobacteria bacterium]|nr:tetratricopeptide repeat protein [Pseudomonadota bacterium]
KSGDHKVALQHWEPLAARGDTEAQFYLGWMYFKGKGISRDLKFAYMWTNLAASRGQIKAKDVRDLIVKEMTPEQIAEAERMVAEWEPKEGLTTQSAVRGEEIIPSAFRPDEFQVGSILGTGLYVLSKNILPFGMISILLMVPPHLFALFVRQDVFPGWGNTAVYIIIYFVVTSFISAALVYGTIQQLNGQQAQLGQVINRGLRFILPVLGVACVMGVITGVGIALFVVPGLIFATMFWVAIPAAVVEGRELSSLGRSLELTKGYRWPILGLVLIIGVLGFVANLIGNWIAAETTSTFFAFLISIVLAGIVTAFGAVVSAVGYYELRIANEGEDAYTVMARFD